MIVSELERLIQNAREKDFIPFFVCATAGTTVLGAYDPLPAIAKICKRENLWFHVDAAWGGAVVFSANQRHKMAGSEHADSLAFNPHKMLGVPLTCSFILTSDLRIFKKGNSLPAGYLFHESDPSSNTSSSINSDNDATSASASLDDLGDLTLQCGRRGDALKLFLSWHYYGTSYYGQRIDEAFSTAAYLTSLVASHPLLELVSDDPPPCLQVCFYYVGDHKGEAAGTEEIDSPERNTWLTKAVAKGLVSRGFMIDHAPGEKGMFLRAVVHLSVTKETVTRLVENIVEVGAAAISRQPIHHR